MAGDDGIGPLLYKELKDELHGIEVMELGVIGLDMVSYIEDGDELVIIDAVLSKDDLGGVLLIEEKDLVDDFKLVSQHDLGVRQTLLMMRTFYPGLKESYIIGVKIKDCKAFQGVSDELLSKIDEIKANVLKLLLEIISRVK